MNSKQILKVSKKFYKQYRSLSLFRRHIKEFGFKTPPYNIINPVLTTSFEQQTFGHKSKTVPDYVYSQSDENPPEEFIYYTNEEIEKIREASKIAAHCVRIAPEILRPGVTTNHLNNILHEEITSKSGYPSVLGFKNFPKSIATSVNNVACHGVPDDRPLENGDIVSFDVTVYKDGFHGVCGSTLVIGEAQEDPVGRFLRSVAEECVFRGISACQPGRLVLDIGAEVAKFSRKRHVKVIPTLTGHGIGRYFHCAPDVYHVMNNFPGQLRPGELILLFTKLERLCFRL